MTIIIIGMSLVSVSFGEHAARLINLQPIFGYPDDWKPPVFRLKIGGFSLHRLNLWDKIVVFLAVGLWIAFILVGVLVASGRGVVFAAIFGPLG